MTDADTPQLVEVLSALADLYRQRLSRPMLEIWAAAMRPYPIERVREALSWHTTHGDAGQFMPKPADVVRYLEGSSHDNALTAWRMVADAIRLIGPWQSVVFDDPLVHVVVADLGGWQALCAVTNDELPFREREFVTRYRSYASRNERPDRIPALIGAAEQGNAVAGRPIAPPLLVGEPRRAREVSRHLAEGPKTAITASKLAKLPELANPKTREEGL